MTPVLGCHERSSEGKGHEGWLRKDHATRTFLEKCSYCTMWCDQGEGVRGEICPEY